MNKRGKLIIVGYVLGTIMNKITKDPRIIPPKKK